MFLHRKGTNEGLVGAGQRGGGCWSSAIHRKKGRANKLLTPDIWTWSKKTPTRLELSTTLREISLFSVKRRSLQGPTKAFTIEYAKWIYKQSM